MRMFSNALEMVKEVERDLYEMGIRYQSATVQDQIVADNPDYETLELIGYQYTLKAFDQLDEVVQYLEGNLTWAKAELNERIRGSLNPGKAWARDFAKWFPFIRDGKFAYHYPERLSHQIQAVIQELSVRPTTRQAVVTMYDVHQDMMNWGGRDRVPCSLSYHFLLRDDYLTLLYTQRSCDFLKFFSTDVWITCGMLNFVGDQLNLPTFGRRFVHSINSLHAFKKDLDAKGAF